MTKVDCLKRLYTKLTGKEITDPDVDTICEVLHMLTDDINISGNSPVTAVSSMNEQNPIILRNLDSGVYVLQGYFKEYEGSTSTLIAQVPISVNVAKTEDTSYVQLFFAYGNQMQYYEITDNNSTEKIINFNELVSGS